MLHKTRGIVFKVTDYSESSVVVQVFTEKFGMQSYIINGVKKPRAKISANMLQPLHLLDMVVYHKGNNSVQRISELRNVPVLQTIPYDIVKSSIVMFLNEVLYKAVRLQTADEDLFSFIFNFIELLDNQIAAVNNFHLLFLVRLSRYLGFYPTDNYAPGTDYFDMKDGVFIRYKPTLSYMSPPYTLKFHQLLQTGFNDVQQLKLTGDERRYLLTKLIEYYALHIEGFGNIRSHEVLEEVLS